MTNKIIDLDLCRLVVENETIKKANAKLWTPYLDRKLNEYVVVYNFNYYEIANKFQDIIILPIKYDFTEEEIRKHWSFLYCCRKINFVPEETYYSNLKNKYKQIDYAVKNYKPIKLSEDTSQHKPIEIQESSIENNISNDTPIVDTNNEDESPSKKVPESVEEAASNIVEKTQIFNKIENKNLTKQEKKYEITPEDELRYDSIIKNIKTDKEEDFPISIKTTNQQENSLNDLSTSKDFDNTINNSKNFDEFVKENDSLNKEYQKINKYFEFAVKGINHFLPKIVNPEGTNEQTLEENKESSYIVETSIKINKLIEDSLKTNTPEALKEKIDTQEKLMDDNLIIEYGNEENDPLYDYYKEEHVENKDFDQTKIKENEKRLELFRQYMFNNNNTDSTNILENIINIISNNNLDEVRIVNDNEINETFECSKPVSDIYSITNSQLYSEQNSNNNSQFINDSQIDKTASKTILYRGIPLKETKHQDNYYENDDSYIEDNN